MDRQRAFLDFDEAIALPQTAIARIGSASDGLQTFLTESLRLPAGKVFLQGSYPNGTAVRPADADGEYDVDIISVMAQAGESADHALERLEQLLGSHGRYAERIVSKAPCVRLEYAEDGVGKFHVDVVPVRSSQQDGFPLEAPRRGEGWHGTAPAEYTAWCQAQGDQFARTVRALKRWRDEQQNVRSAIKSIVLQVLVAEYMPSVSDEGQRLHETISAMHEALSGLRSSPQVFNTVLPSEDLARRWTEAAFKDFVRELGEARDNANRAAAAEDDVDWSNAWKDVLGDAFPLPGADRLGIQLSDDSHARTFADEAWIERLDPRYGIRVEAFHTRGLRARQYQYLATRPETLIEGRKLRFVARTRGPDDCDVWWQVANTGAHAREASANRGDWFRARKLDGKASSNPRENWENSRYTGSHWIRAALVKDGIVVACSPKFVVHIWNPRHRFGV